MEVVVSLVSLVLLATAAAADTSGNHPSQRFSLPEIQIGELWNPRRQNSESRPVTLDQSGSKRSVTLPDIQTGELWNPRFQNSESSPVPLGQSGSKRSVIQPEAETENVVWKPIAEGFETSLVKLRPVYVSIPDDGDDLNVKQGLDETQKRPSSNDQTGELNAIGSQKNTSKKENEQPVLKTQLQKNPGKRLPSTLRPPKPPRGNNAPRNEHAPVHSVINHDLQLQRFTGAPSLGLQGIFPTFKPSHLVRKGVFPPEAFLPLHPSRVTNSSYSEVVSKNRLNFLGSVNNAPINGAISPLPRFSTQPSQGRGLRSNSKIEASEKSKLKPAIIRGHNSQQFVSKNRSNFLGSVNNAPISFLPQFSTQPSQGRGLRSNKKIVASENSKLNPAILGRQNLQQFSKSHQPLPVLPTFGSNLNFRNVPQFTSKPVSQERDKVVRKLPGSLPKNTLQTHGQVPAGASIPTFATKDTNLELRQSFNNVSNVVTSDPNSQSNSDWQGFILSEINKWPPASTDHGTAVGNDTSSKLPERDVHLSATKSIPAHKFTIQDDKFQTEIVTARPSTQQKRSENTLTEVHKLKPTRVDETGGNPVQDFSQHLQNRVFSQQATFPARNLPNHGFQRRVLGPERNGISGDSLPQATEISQSSFPGITKRDTHGTRFSVDDGFLKQFSQPGNRPRTASITSEKLREVLAGASDSMNLKNLNSLDESQKIAVLQGIYKTLNEHSVKKPLGSNGAIKSFPARSFGTSEGGIKADRSRIQKLDGNHVFGIQEIAGYKFRPSPSPSEAQHSINFSHKKKFQPIQPTKFLHSSQFMPAPGGPKSSRDPQSQKLSFDEKPPGFRQQLPSQFPLAQLITPNLHHQLLAQLPPPQNPPRNQPSQNLISHSNLQRQPTHVKSFLDLTGEKLESPSESLQSSSPRDSFRGQPLQSIPQGLSSQTPFELLNRNPSSKAVLTPERDIPSRSERTAKKNLDIVQLEGLKLASGEVYYPRLPLEAQIALRNSLIPLQDFKLPTSLTKMEDSSSTPVGSNQENIGHGPAPALGKQSQVAEPDTLEFAPVASEETITLSLREAQDILENSEFINNEKEILRPEIPLQRQGAFHRPNFSDKKPQFRESPPLQSPIGQEFMRVAEPPSVLGDPFSAGLESGRIDEEYLNRFPDIRQLFGNHHGRDERISREIFNHEDEPNFEQKIKVPTTFRVPRPIQTHGSDFAPNEVEQLAPGEESRFKDYEDIAEKEGPSSKLAPYHLQDRDSKFFPKNGYDIDPFFRGFPPFGFFSKTL